MALVKGSTTTHRLDCGSGATLDDLDPFTYVFWVFPTAAGMVHGKGGSDQKRALFRAGDTFRAIVTRATIITLYESSTTFSLNAWNLVAWSFDSGAGAGSLIHIYKGTPAALASEVAYATQTDGSGAVTSEAAGNL